MSSRVHFRKGPYIETCHVVYGVYGLEERVPFGPESYNVSRHQHPALAKRVLNNNDKKPV